MPEGCDNATHADEMVGQAPGLETAIPALDRLSTRLAAKNSAQVSTLRVVPLGLEALEQVLVARRAGEMTNLKELQTDESLVRLGKLSESNGRVDALDFIGEMRLESGDRSGHGRSFIPAC